MDRAIKYKIPKGLSLAVMNNKRARKALDTWIVLKALFPHGRFLKGDLLKMPVKEIKEHFGISSRTLWQRLQELTKMELASADNVGFIHLASYQDLSQKYQTWPGFYYVKPGYKLEYVLEQKALFEKQKQCKGAFTARINNTTGLKVELESVVGAPLRADILTDAQLTAFRTNGAGYDENDLWLINALRADTQIGYAKLSQLYGYKSRGGLAYKKRLLQKVGLWVVKPRSVKLPTKNKTTSASRRTNLGRVFYFRPEKSLILILPDLIHFLSHNL